MAEQQTTVVTTTTTTTSSGINLDEKTRAFMAYIFFLVSAIIFIILERQSFFVLFHAWQMLFLVLFWIPIWIVCFIIDVYAIRIGFLVLGFIAWMIFIAIWIFCMIQVFRLHPTAFKLPLIGKLAAKQASNMIAK